MKVFLGLVDTKQSTVTLHNGGALLTLCAASGAAPLSLQCDFPRCSGRLTQRCNALVAHYRLICRCNSEIAGTEDRKPNQPVPASVNDTDAFIFKWFRHKGLASVRKSIRSDHRSSYCGGEWMLALAGVVQQHADRLLDPQSNTASRPQVGVAPLWVCHGHFDQ